MFKKLFLLTILTLLIVSVVKAQLPNSFLKVNFVTKTQLDQLYTLTNFSVDYVYSETNSQKNYFLGLFDDADLEILKNNGFQFEVVDENVTDLSSYWFVSYPGSDGKGEEKISAAGSYYKLAENQYIFRLPYANYDRENLDGFFIADLPKNPLPSPKYQTPRITLAPTAEMILNADVSPQNSIITFIFRLGLIIIIITLVFIIIKLCRTFLFGSGKLQ